MFLNKNIILLLLGQGFSGAVVSLLTFSSALAGKWLLSTNIDSNIMLESNVAINCHSLDFATFPVSATLIGAFLAIIISSNLMQQFGQKRIFLYACFIGAIGALIAIFALFYINFWIFCFGTFLLGFFSATNQFYRFLATQAIRTNAKNSANKATAFVVGGGIIGAILGPNLANIGANMLNTPFICSFIFAFLLCVLNFILTLALDLKPIATGKNMLKISFIAALKDLNFLLSLIACAFCFSFMTLLMNAAPLAMNENFTLNEAKNIIVWHFIAMYAPSLFLGFFMRKITPFKLILLGVLCYFIAALIGLFGDGFVAFWLNLVLVGLGWAFGFNGGTFLLNSIKSPYILRLQSFNAMAVFGANLCASSSIGFILSSGNWKVLNVIGLGLILLFFIIIFGIKSLQNNKILYN